MTPTGLSPDLRRLAAEQLATYLESVEIGSGFVISPSAALCDILEFLIPRVLGECYPEWQKESLDGFFISSAVKKSEVSAELMGTCILISDQSVTPFRLDMSLSTPPASLRLRIRLGEAGGGALAISGPAVTSKAATDFLGALDRRIETVDWVYDVES